MEDAKTCMIDVSEHISSDSWDKKEYKNWRLLICGDTRGYKNELSNIRPTYLAVSDDDCSSMVYLGSQDPGARAETITRLQSWAGPLTQSLVDELIAAYEAGYSRAIIYAN